MSLLPCNLYRAAQVRELDRIAIEAFGIPGGVLMERAGAAASALLQRRWPQARRVAVLCGAGNNGGDGFVVARLALAAGLEVDVYGLCDATRLGGEALAAFQALTAGGLPVEADLPPSLGEYDVLVDALLGTGLRGPVQGQWLAAIEAINASGVPVLALDVPSGLDADTGQPLGAAVRAQATISFIGLKMGLFMGDGPDYCGAVEFDDLQVPAAVYASLEPTARVLEWSECLRALPPRRRTAHKGEFGHVLVIGGERGMSGAARMAAEAAARIGAGLVSVATRGAHAAQLNIGRPELMVHGAETRDEPMDGLGRLRREQAVEELQGLLARATVVAIGPGLGQGEWGRHMLAQALAAGLPLVLDADALNLLAQAPQSRADWILTPHPGEAGRLLGCTAADVQADRFAAVAALQQRYGGVCVLKGTGTLVEDGSHATGLCTAGNPGMASGGMGDVLTGAIAGLLAQGLTPHQAACLGARLHAQAADAAARDGGERGLLASDLMPYLRRLVNTGGTAHE